MAVQARQDPNLGGSLPPHSIEAEQWVLGSCLIDPEAFPLMAAKLRADDFYRPAHRQIAEAMVRVAARGAPTDYALVSDELARVGRLDLVGGDAYLGRLMGVVPTAVHVEHYADIVLRTSYNRQIVQIAQRMAAAAWADGDPAQIEEAALRGIDENRERFGLPRRRRRWDVETPIWQRYEH